MRHTRVIHDGSCGIALKPFLWNDIQLPQFTYLATVIEVLSDAATCGPVPAELWAKKDLSESEAEDPLKIMNFVVQLSGPDSRNSRNTATSTAINAAITQPIQ
jgi:hypothetical protein